MNNERQIRRKDRHVTDFDEISDIIRRNHTGVISMVDGCLPYGVMMNYGALFEGNKITLIFHGAKSGRKLDCLRKNPQVSVFINDVENMQVIDAGTASSKWTTHYRSVILSGNIRLLDDLPAKRQAAEKFMRHYTQGELELPDAVLNATLFMELEATHISCKKNPSSPTQKEG